MFEQNLPDFLAIFHFYSMLWSPNIVLRTRSLYSIKTMLLLRKHFLAIVYVGVLLDIIALGRLLLRVI